MFGSGRHPREGIGVIPRVRAVGEVIYEAVLGCGGAPVILPELSPGAPPILPRQCQRSFRPPRRFPGHGDCNFANFSGFLVVRRSATVGGSCTLIARGIFIDQSWRLVIMGIRGAWSTDWFPFQPRRPLESPFCDFWASGQRRPAVSHRVHCDGTNTVINITGQLVGTCAEMAAYGNRRRSPCQNTSPGTASRRKA